MSLQSSNDSSSVHGQSSRRDFMKKSGVITASGALLGAAAPAVHAEGDSTIRLAIIGCGNRGGGALRDAMSVPNESVELYAMADLYEDKIDACYQAINNIHEDKVNVTDDRKFTGFDAYRQAIDALRPGDVVLLTTRSSYRPIHLAYAVEKGINVFMEKPFAPDPGWLKHMLASGKIADEKNLKIAAGLMCRHSPARQAMIERIREGELGEIMLMRGYRYQNENILQNTPSTDRNELEYQIRNGRYFLWVGSGRYVEWMIHQIDECCWLKDSLPVKALGLSGRFVGSRDCSQNLDTFSVEYTWEDGAKAKIDLRTINGCSNDFATYVHGTNKAGMFSGPHHRSTCQIYNDWQISKNNVEWKADRERHNLHCYEWIELLRSIREDRPHNETERAVMSDYVACMGRAAAHSGKTITLRAIQNSDFQYCEDLESFDENSEVPVHCDSDGRYPIPSPGVWNEI